MKKTIMVLIIAFLSIGASPAPNILFASSAKDEHNKRHAPGIEHLKNKAPVIECYPDGCCYEMNTRTIWSCET